MRITNLYRIVPVVVLVVEVAVAVVVVCSSSASSSGRRRHRRRLVLVLSSSSSSSRPRPCHRPRLCPRPRSNRGSSQPIASFTLASGRVNYVRFNIFASCRSKDAMSDIDNEMDTRLEVGFFL